MKDRLAKLIDLKSIITLILIAGLMFLVIYSAITGKDLSNDVFLLFSNIITMVVTYFFTKQKEKTNE